MIDLHCHLLPNIDDGPKSLEEALTLAELAAKNGIIRAIATPHIHPGRYENDRINIQDAYARFSRELKERGIPLLLGFSAEVRMGPEIIPMIERNEIPFLGSIDGYKVMLLEFPHSHIPIGSEKLVNWLLARKIRPMIAHPERNKEIVRNPEKASVLIRKGCMLQVTAGSVSGLFGSPVQKAAAYLLKNDWIFAMASDAHNFHHRPPEMESGRRVAEKILGEEASWNLVRQNPMSIIFNG